jgi:signal transduction histidine kinase
MNNDRWQPTVTNDIVFALLVWGACYAYEFIAGFLLHYTQTAIGYYYASIPVAILLALLVPRLGNEPIANDMREICWYDVAVQIIGFVACLLHYSEVPYWILSQFIIVLKMTRVTWPLLRINFDLPATWPAFGFAGYFRQRREGATAQKLTPAHRRKLGLLIPIGLVCAIVMQQAAAFAAFPVSSIATLYFTLRYTRRIMAKLAAREQQTIAAIEAAAQANADIAIANERLKNQAVIEAQNTALAEKNAALQTLSEQQAAVVKDLEERNQSLRDANHDLKQPINILRNRIDFALRLASNEEQIKLLNAVDLGMEELSLIMHGIIDQARASTLLNVPPMKAIALKDLANYCYLNYFALAQKHDMYFEQAEKPGELDGAVFCNEMLLKRILGNLLNNAILHGTPDGTIRLHFCRSGKSCTIWVSDNGKGIADANGRDHAANFANLVEKLTQEQALFNAGQEALDGHRLGLMSVQRLCAELGVGMRLKSSPRFGTTFCFVVPLAA